MPIDNVASATPTQAAWRVQLLGGLCASPGPETPGNQSGALVEQFRTHKAALLLARLALFPHRAHAREELADLLWPEAPADRGRASLTQTLVYLRAALQQPRTGGLIVADHKTVRIAKNGLQTDVAIFEAAARHALTASGAPEEQTVLVQAALDAYRGELLTGFYDDWVCDERSRLEAVRDQLQECLSLLNAASSPVPTTVSTTPRPEAVARPESGRQASDTPCLLNAPLFLTRFFGRERDRASVCCLLEQNPPVRLITLLGMGGIGKTRLAVEIAQSVVGDTNLFGWAAFVPLDQARTADQVESILLSVLGIQSQDTDNLAVAAKYLNACGKTRTRKTGSGTRLLLVLDNLEQLEDAAAPFVAALLTQVPGLTILTTSRQPVGIAGEREIPLGPLASRADGTAELPEDAQLFVDRASLARPSFTLTPENRDAVTRLCAVLEGVPLALELAAAWMRVLTPVQIAARLSNRFDVLALRGASAASDGITSKRHHSLRAAIAWSYDLLGPALQTFWVQLSVFRGGWALEAAQAVTEVQDASEPLLLLTERSLIIAETEDATGQVRYRMLESLREFAHEQAQVRGDDFCAALQLRHAQYLASISQEAEAMTKDGRGMRPALLLLGPERDNLRAILTRLQEVTQQLSLQPVTVREAAAGDENTWVSFVQAAIENTVQSVWLWPRDQSRSSLQVAVEATAWLPEEKSRPLRADLLSAQGFQAFYIGDYQNAERQMRESLALFEVLGKKERVFAVKSRLASLANRTNRETEARSLWLECLHFAEQTGDTRREAAMLTNLANYGQDLTQRRAWIERAVVLYRQHSPGSYFLACALNTMGNTALEQKDWNVARQCLEEAHQIALADEAKGMIGIAKANLAELLYATGESLDRAERLLEEAEALFEEIEELPRVAEVGLKRFQFGLQCGDADTALRHAHKYLRVIADTAMLDAAGLASARADLAGKLRDAGFSAHAASLETSATLKEQCP